MSISPIVDSWLLMDPRRQRSTHRGAAAAAAAGALALLGKQRGSRRCGLGSIDQSNDRG
jgi:hypothetical protein